jgi:hypothetical protein
MTRRGTTHDIAKHGAFIKFQKMVRSRSGTPVK